MSARTGLVAGALAGLAVAVPLGPVGAHLVSVAAREGLRSAVPLALAVATADGTCALLAAVGGAGLGRLLAPLEHVLRPVCAVVLLLLALRVLRDARRPVVEGGVRSGSPGRRALGMLALTLANPGTVAPFLALVLAQPALGGPLAAGAFAVAALTASAAWQLLLVGAGAGLGRVLVTDRARRASGVVAALLVAGLALRLVLPPLPR